MCACVNMNVFDFTMIRKKTIEIYWLQGVLSATMKLAEEQLESALAGAL